MQKGKLIEEVKRKLDGGNSTTSSKYHPAEIEEHIAYIYDEILKELWQSVKLDKNYRVFDTLTKNYNERIKCDDSGEYYVDIPVNYSGIPNYVAFRVVRPLKDTSINIVPIDSASLAIFKNLPISQVDNTEGYYFEYDKLKLWNHDKRIKDLTMKIVVGFDEFEGSDNVAIPNSMKGNILDLVMEKLLPLYGIKPDKVNDEELTIKSETK